jgi:putative transcriptional regulator
MIRFHPTNQTLVSFAEGLTAPNESLLVSAHCDMCDQCATRVAALVECYAEQSFNECIPSQADHALGNMLDAILSRPEASLKRKVIPNQNLLTIDGKEFHLPASLQRLASQVGDWSHLVGKLWQAPVSLGGKNLANFIYMENGGGVPEHTHIGNELTLVINGSFEDELHHYQTGDYLSFNHLDIHTPTSNAKEGCLVFSIIDQPLQFTSGWAKLINPLSHLYFKVSTKL